MTEVNVPRITPSSYTKILLWLNTNSISCDANVRWSGSIPLQAMAVLKFEHMEDATAFKLMFKI